MMKKIDQNNMPIVTASNNDYAPYTEVMIRTLLEHLDSDSSVDFYIIDDGLSDQHKAQLYKAVATTGQDTTLEFIELEPELYQDCLVSDHITTTAYLRISVPPILREKGYQRALYIDADTFILTDVTELLTADLAGKTIGAVIDPGQAEALERLGIQSEDYYFNSGVMVIDLARWQEKKITAKTRRYLTEEADKIIYHDQDALNAVLYEDWKALHPKWNMQTSLIFDRYKAPTEKYDVAYDAGRDEPAIIHFTGHDKPWNTLEGHPYQEAYLEKLAEIQSQKVGIYR